MLSEKRFSRVLAVLLFAVFITAQAMTTGTAAFAEEKEIVRIEECNPLSSKEIAESNQENQKYKKETLQRIAQEYHVDYDYLEYISHVEETFQLEPYELFALIAIESKFVSSTKMDGGSLSFNTTQMKLATAKTAYMAITDYYHQDITFPDQARLTADRNYAAYLAGGYLRYLHDVYKNQGESYTAYRMGINGRLTYYQAYGNYESPYAVQIKTLSQSFKQY
ncbi:hypothetical protein LPY66_02085 [Dehalobacter sp. DCM]|uniref:hypothetical protein n=1 Tax=Dehalobacter sp. DCM TaxID=2907827 RepID=UPI003081A4AE|nr:hypothetical protein LPY66_02085 [Dehalobacter sp. DCM]